MDDNNRKKHDQLGMPHGTAMAQLRKRVLFELLKRHGENICFQCGTVIETVDELSIEHKIPWLDSSSPKELFFEIENIAFSHLHCNVGAARHRESEHGDYNKYQKGCRCPDCRSANARNRRITRANHKATMRL
jgi:hypothetical protein